MKPDSVPVRNGALLPVAMWICQLHANACSTTTMTVVHVTFDKCKDMARVL